MHWETSLIYLGWHILFIWDLVFWRSMPCLLVGRSSYNMSVLTQKALSEVDSLLALAAQSRGEAVFLYVSVWFMDRLFGSFWYGNACRSTCAQVGLYSRISGKRPAPNRFAIRYWQAGRHCVSANAAFLAFQFVVPSLKYCCSIHGKRGFPEEAIYASRCRSNIPGGPGQSISKPEGYTYCYPHQGQRHQVWGLPMQ